MNWRTGAEVARIAGPLTKPALDWPYIAYIRALPVGQSLELLNTSTGATRAVESSRSAGVDIGRPALRGGLIAWHVAAGRRSQIRIARVDRRTHRVVASSVTGLQVNPSLAEGRILWVEQSGRNSYLRLQRLSGGQVRTLATHRGSSRFLWTTALGSRTAYATRWNPTTGRGELISRRWR